MELNASGTSYHKNEGSSVSKPRTNGRSQKPTREEELRRQITRLMNKEKKDGRRNEANDNDIDTNTASNKHSASTELAFVIKKSTNELSEPERTAPDLNEDDILSQENENDDDDVLEHIEANNTITPFAAPLSPIIEEGTTISNAVIVKSSSLRKQRSKGKRAAKDNYTRYLALEDDIIGESNDHDDAEGTVTEKETKSSTGSNTPPSKFVPSSSSTPKVSLKNTPNQPSRNLPSDVRNDAANTLELTALAQKYEKRIRVLEADKQSLTIKNEKMETLHKPLEEKVVKLKKRNTELASIAKRLEEKAKELQRNSGKSV
ncbi:uncharacterized protein LOC117114279 [Anneissia japonica]|uniref:uncharacterized protein LOC117114279 n=1 Tax=Anneissia japonica TaxID=1529436 RepID=UPI0014258DD9|nr:uncharacterized protein LOC117114279 [Anneissia japonica]